MDKYDELLIDGQYNILEAEMKRLLVEDNDNSRLWYLLFLSQNNNYIDIDFNNLKNEIAFNNAIEKASMLEEMKYKLEFEFYKNLSKLPGFDLFFRMYQFKKYDLCKKILIDLCKMNYDKIRIDNNLCELIKVYIDTVENDKQVKLKVALLNLIYVITKNDTLKNMLDECLKQDIVKKLINNYSIKENKEDIYNFLLSNNTNVEPVKQVKIIEREKPVYIEKAQPKVEEHPKPKKKSAIASFFEVLLAVLFLLYHFIPITITIIFGIILFTNHNQIEIRSNFGLWTFGWVIALLISIVFSLVYVYAFVKDKFESNVYVYTIIGSIPFVLIVILVGAINSSKLEKKFYPPNDITIKYESIKFNSYSSMPFTIYYEVSNSGKLDVSYIFVTMEFYKKGDESSTHMQTYEVEYRGLYNANSTTRVSVDYYDYNSVLPDFTEDELEIKYKIDRMCFNNKTKEYKYKTEYVQLK